MARNRETKIELTAYDDLFQTDESRAEAALSKIRDIPISEIDEFPDHPFKVLMDEDIANGIGMIVLIILVAIAAVMFISSGSKTAPFAYLEKEKFETEYGVSGMVKERKAQYKDLHTKNNIAGTCLCIAALIPLFIGAIINADSDLFLTIMLSLSFLIAGVGVICFIKTGVIWASYEKLLQEGEYSKENKERPSFSAAIYTAYWLIATAVYLGYSLSSNNWGQSWIIWVVAGVIFPAVIAITNAFEKKSK